MVTFRNNKNHNRRRFRSNDRNFRRGDNVKFKSDFSTNVNFQRKTPGRNNHNASKLIEKYTDLAREALANEDKILSENYFQHADHFTRILNEKENINHLKEVNEINKNTTTTETKDSKEEDKKIVNN
tara:strand:- start:283 stop:663 length:381 start_codon:yes stop_codon:yes gene_type:complete